MRGAISRTKQRWAQRALPRHLDRMVSSAIRFQERRDRLINAAAGAANSPAPEPPTIPASFVHHPVSQTGRMTSAFQGLHVAARDAATELEEWGREPFASLDRTATEESTARIRGGEVYLGHFGSSVAT
jgi:hypothetical protein